MCHIEHHIEVKILLYHVDDERERVLKKREVRRRESFKILLYDVDDGHERVLKKREVQHAPCSPCSSSTSDRWMLSSVTST